MTFCSYSYSYENYPYLSTLSFCWIRIRNTVYKVGTSPNLSFSINLEKIIVFDSRILEFAQEHNLDVSEEDLSSYAQLSPGAERTAD